MTAIIHTSFPRRLDPTNRVEVSVDGSENGNAVISLNGVHALVITSKGYLRRLRGLPEQAGVRRLADGRIAIKPAAAS